MEFYNVLVNGLAETVVAQLAIKAAGRFVGNIQIMSESFDTPPKTSVANSDQQLFYLACAKIGRISWRPIPKIFFSQELSEVSPCPCI
jgi:hypothetical protein